jgi:hypothetical protein
MARVKLGWLYAALKSCCSTVGLEAVEASSVHIESNNKSEVKGNIKINVKGDGPECPSHTSQWWKCPADDGVQG